MPARYRIQKVSELTEVPAPTLRAWERRYGLPNPERSSSSYRLYSEHDVEQVRQLKALIEEGMAPAEAARSVKAAFTAPSPAPALAQAPADARQVAIDRIVEAVERTDSRLLEHELRGALYLGNAADVTAQILTPALVEVGERWHRRQLSVAQEHLASEVIGTAVRELVRSAQPAAPTRRALLACFPDELHAIPLYVAALHLIDWGYGVDVLGARVPADALADAIERIGPDLVGLSVTMLPPADRTERTLDELAEVVGDLPWIVGGSGSEQLRELIEARGGLVVGEQIHLARAAVEEAVRLRAAAPTHRKARG